jgi:mono/diheme cytochrome c family protein
MGSNPPNFSVDEMRDLLSYLWAGQFFQDSSKASAGRKVFAQKQCAGCHENGQSGAPKLPMSGRSFSSATMVAALWHHGPRMEELIRANHSSWPLFSGPEMAELIAYLGSEEKKAP